MKLFGVGIILCLFILSGCKENNSIRPNNGGSSADVWLVNKADIVNWESEKDKIQSIDTNEFIPISQSNIRDNDMVFAYHYNGITKVYPVSIMGGHEISNDSIGSHYYSITYCPITESALAWNRKINGKVNQFGVSGKLYRNNLIPYDRQTGSHFSQMGSLGVNGKLIGYEVETNLLIETRFSAIKLAFPDAIVLDHHHCEDGICTRHKQGLKFSDPIETNEENNLPSNSSYFGIVKGEHLLLFDHALFDESISLFETSFAGNKIIVVGSSKYEFFAAFKFQPDNNEHIITAFQNDFPVVMIDSKGNRYDLFGNIIEGPDTGKRLRSPTAYRAHTFAWDDLFSDIQIYKPGN